MGVPSIEAEEADASSLSEYITLVPIASLPGRLPLHVIDRIRDSKSRMRSRKRSGWERSYGSIYRFIGVI